MVVEGVNTARAATELAGKYNVSMPITEAVAGVLFNGKDVRKVVYSLMMRDKISEI